MNTDYEETPTNKCLMFTNENDTTKEKTSISPSRSNHKFSPHNESLENGETKLSSVVIEFPTETVFTQEFKKEKWQCRFCGLDGIKGTIFVHETVCPKRDPGQTVTSEDLFKAMDKGKIIDDADEDEASADAHTAPITTRRVENSEEEYQTSNKPLLRNSVKEEIKCEFEGCTYKAVANDLIKHIYEKHKKSDLKNVAKPKRWIWILLILVISLIIIALLIITIYYAAIKDYDDTNSDAEIIEPINNEEEIESLQLTIKTQNTTIKDLREQLGNKSSIMSNHMSMMLYQENRIAEFSSSQSCPTCETCPTCPNCPICPNCPECPDCPICPDCPVCPPPCSDACTITGEFPKFLSVIATSEIYLNEYNSCKYYDTQLLSSEVTTETTKYISGGEKVTIYNIVNKNTYKVLQQFEHAASGCFIHSLGNSAFCCSLGGIVWKYDLDATPITESVFYTEVNDKYYSCIESDKDDYLLILGLPNEYKIIDNVGTKVKTHFPSQVDYISDSEEFKPYQIAERHPGEFIIAHTNRLSIISTFSTVEEPFFTDTRSVLALKTANYFAVGGRQNKEGIAVGGAIRTYTINKGDTQIKLVEKHLGNGGENCIITVLQELEEGTLIFGGKENCNEWCIWKYMETDSKLICVPYINQISKKVLDIIPILI